MRERERENRDMSLLASKLAAEDQYDYVCERKGGREWDHLHQRHLQIYIWMGLQLQATLQPHRQATTETPSHVIFYTYMTKCIYVSPTQHQQIYVCTGP